MTSRIVLLLVAILLVVGFLAGCGDHEEKRLIPDPVVVTDAAVPGPGPGVFYHLGVTHEQDVRPLLEQLLDRGVVIDAAWQPRTPSLCAIPTAREALALLVKGDTSAVSSLELVDDPSPWVPNCGVAEFLEYRL